METLTHWKKNIDQNFISGEDLQSEIKGLKKEMVVVIDHFGDEDSFDQNSQKKKLVTGLYLKELSTGQPLFKPVVLNKTNAKFFCGETKSQFLEHWVGVPVVVYACPDKRFGFVVRFKKYYPPAAITDTRAIGLLSAAANLEELGMAWSTLTPEEKKLATVMAKKESMKEQFTNATKTAA